MCYNLITKKVGDIMAKKRKRRRSKKDKGMITLAIMLGVIFLIIGIFVVKALDKDKNQKVPTTDVDEVTFSDSTDDFYVPETEDEENTESESESISETETTEIITEETTEETTEEIMDETTEEVLTESENPEHVIEAVIYHYADYMGFPVEALFIQNSETVETAAGYTFTLRLNAAGAPNKLIGDVYVEKGTGAVTDSMGNEPWNIAD